ncbi:MAG: hypothetical protein K0S27_11 [Gammaproteobacteria bacterium]|jgi:hypothetical protein|nr:hypothetical protein [Gammaproteobacteria bacterium]
MDKGNDSSIRKENIWSYVIIFLFLFLALSPVIVSDNYLRQDDLKTGIWWGMSMPDEGYLYYNTVYQLVRPLCFFLFFIIDLLSINMHYAVYVRLMSIIVVAVSGILLYRWQLLFNPNRLLAMTFAIAVFTLPGIQLFAATANYFLILFGILLVLGGALCWYKAYVHEARSAKRRYYLIGCLLFFASLLDYPLSSMYVWSLLIMAYLNTLRIVDRLQAIKKRFFYVASAITLSMTMGYFIFIKLFHFIFKVNLSYGTPAVIDTTHLPLRFVAMINILILHAHQWLYEPVDPRTNYFPIVFILLSCAAAFARIHFLNGQRHFLIIARNIGVNLGVCFILFVLAYSPLLALPGISYTFRYTVATMPILLYLFFWSVNENSILYTVEHLFLTNLLKKFCAILFIGIMLFGMYHANMMTADGIVGPQTRDFEFIERELTEKFIPLIKQHKRIALHVIECDQSLGKSYIYEPHVPNNLEYGMRLCMFPNHLIGAINHSLMTLGYISNFHRANTVLTIGKETIVKDIPWGYMVFSTSDKVHYSEGNVSVITIDMRRVTPYKHLDFYKGL